MCENDLNQLRKVVSTFDGIETMLQNSMGTKMTDSECQDLMHLISDNVHIAKSYYLSTLDTIAAEEKNSLKWLAPQS